MEGELDSRELRRFPFPLNGFLELTVLVQSCTSLAYLFSRLSHAFGFGLCTSYAAASRIRDGGRTPIYADTRCWRLNLVHSHV